MDQTRIDPITKAILVRSTRMIALRYRSHEVLVDLPGWYDPDDPTGESGLYSADDMAVSDAVVERLRNECGIEGTRQSRGD